MQLQTRKTMFISVFAALIFLTSAFSSYFILNEKVEKKDFKDQVNTFKQLILQGRYQEGEALLNDISTHISIEEKKVVIDVLKEKGSNILQAFPGELIEDKSLEFTREAKLYSKSAAAYGKLLNGDYELEEILNRLNASTLKIRDIYLSKAEEMKAAYRFDEALAILNKLAMYFEEEGLILDRQALCAKEKKFNEDLVPFEGEVEHIFFHPLIAFPELAFDGDSQALGYDDWFVTVKEFKTIIESMYKNQYILIDINSIFEKIDVNGVEEVKRKTLMLPRGKKPVILSIDDLNYYDYMIKNGNVHKLILDEKGDIATLSVKPNGERIVSKDNEILPIIDEFVKTHSDFSFRGAKGVIALTGFEGVLGYRTQKLDSPSFDSEKNEALKVIKRLKETGWTFASHSYGHPDVAKISYERMAYDTNKWKKEVETLIGPTAIYIYPYGSSVLPGDGKYQLLVDSGFKMFCAVGPTPYTKFMKYSIMMDRRHIDGIALRRQGESLKDFFDVKEVFDQIRPKR